MPTPTPSELALINVQRVEMGLEPYDAPEQALTLKIRAIHNLLTRSNYTWDVRTGLIPLAETYVGKPVIINHEWFDVSATQGRVLQAYVEKKEITEIPEEIKNNKNPIKQKIVADILSKTGYYELICLCWFDAETPAKNSINQGLYHEVSIGALGGNEYFCPNSQKRMEPDYDSSNFYQFVCEHELCQNCLLDTTGELSKFYFSEEELSQSAVIHYFLTGDISEAIELSFVMLGNVVGANVVPNK